MDSVVLLPDQESVALRKRFHATSPRGSFATALVTPGAFFEGAWNSFGDGRLLASPAERFMAMRFALHEKDLSTLGSAENTPQVLLGLVDNILGLSDANCLLESVMPFSGILEDYEQALAEKGLVDPCRACLILSSDCVVDVPMTVDVRFVDLAPAQRVFFSSQERVVLIEQDAKEAESESVPPVEALCSAGRYAQPASIKDALGFPGEYEQAVVACADPRRFYTALADGLLERGFSCSVTAYMALPSTYFGQALFAAYNLLFSDGLNKDAASDYALNPFSGLLPVDAHGFNASLRSDRLATKIQVLEFFALWNRSLEYFEEMFTDPEASVLLGYFEDVACSVDSWDEAAVQRELSALKVVRGAMAASCSFGGDALSWLSFLKHAVVADARIAGEGGPLVAFMPHRQAAALPLGWADVLIAADMTSEDYLPDEPSGIVGEILDCVVQEEASFAEEERCGVFSLMGRIPRCRFMVEFPLHDWDGNDLRPAFVLQERGVFSRADDLGNVDGFSVRGEEHLLENLACVDSIRLIRDADSAEKRLSLDEPKGLFPFGKGSGAIWISPSSAEAYMACPHRWFVQNRLAPRCVDETMDASCQGRFSHEVLRRFYEQFQGEGNAKVLPENLCRARRIMDAVLDECRMEQAGLEPNRGRLVPMGELEQRRLDEISCALRAYLDTESSLLPSFRPAYLEYEIPREELARYAGFQIRGTVDRIDVDSHGRAVIIDYKPSVSKDSKWKSPGGSPEEDIRTYKVQALIYAQLVRRVLGLDVVGALYVGYGAHCGVAGAVDSSVMPELDGVSEAVLFAPDTAGYASFAAYLDDVEASLAEALEGMKTGDVAPGPASDASCKHCFVPLCPRRRAKHEPW